jgi:formylmethanofuran dehydrogenase subunit E
MVDCVQHPGVEAVTTCANCGAPLCEECSVKLKGKIYCTKCVSDIVGGGTGGFDGGAGFF